MLSFLFTIENYISEIHNLHQGGANGGAPYNLLLVEFDEKRGVALMLTLLELNMAIFR